MPTFILKNNPGLKNKITLDKDDAHHLKRVMRIEIGETIQVTDNAGHLSEVEVTSLDPLAFKTLKPLPTCKPSPIIMHMPLIERERLEWAIQKLTELNIKTVQLVVTERTQKIKFETKKMERLHKIAVAAQKQCGRSYPLEILAPIKLCEINLDPDQLHIVGSITPPENDIPPFKLSSKPCNLYIGPEGGLTKNEMKHLIQKGAMPVSLATTVLRSETAAIVLTTWTQLQ